MADEVFMLFPFRRGSESKGSSSVVSACPRFAGFSKAGFIVSIPAKAESWASVSIPAYFATYATFSSTV